MKISTITKAEMKSLLELAPDASEDENDVIIGTYNLPEESRISDEVDVDDPEAHVAFFQVRLMRDYFTSSCLVAIHSFLSIIKKMQKIGIDTDDFTIKYEEDSETFIICKEYALINKPFTRDKKGGEA